MHAELLKEIQPFFLFIQMSNFQQMTQVYIRIRLSPQSMLPKILLLNGRDHHLTDRQGINRMRNKANSLLMMDDQETLKRENLTMAGFLEHQQWLQQGLNFSKTFQCQILKNLLNMDSLFLDSSRMVSGTMYLQILLTPQIQIPKLQFMVNVLLNRWGQVGNKLFLSIGFP